VTIPENLKFAGKTTEEKIGSLLEEYSEIKKIGRIIILQYKNIQKIDIDCSFDGGLAIEKVHDLTSQIERKIRSEFKNAIITIHPEPN
jgi:divalent metal cation (Fe/Co/Zn/Cd) transporter